MKGRTLSPTAVGSETVSSFLALHSVVTVTSKSADSAEFCSEMPFHWNGTELVICAIHDCPWPSLDASPLCVSVMAGTLHFRFEGVGSTDQVQGIAPEYREQLVTYLGTAQGHRVANQAGQFAVTYRLFITPRWSTESADR